MDGGCAFTPHNTDKTQVKLQDGQGADDGTQLPGLRVRMYGRLCRRRKGQVIPCQGHLQRMGVLRQEESRARNGRGACYLCVKHGGVPSKKGRKHPRELAYSSASVGAIEVANRLVDGQIKTIRGQPEHILKIEINIEDRSTRFLVAELRYRVKLDGWTPHCVIKGKSHGEVVELGEKDGWKVPSLMQQKFEERWRPGTRVGKRRGLTITSWQMPMDCKVV